MTDRTLRDLILTGQREENRERRWREWAKRHPNAAGVMAVRRANVSSMAAQRKGVKRG
jgi:hypothetical protein